MKLDTRKPLFSIATVLAAFALSACSTTSSATPPATAADSSATAMNTDSDANAQVGATSVQVSKTVRDRCSMPAEPQNAPKFEFDQATVRSSGKNVLDEVATCLREGPLKSEVITLVGRADPRGSEEYNESLAASRAAAVRDYLVQRGVPGDRVRLMSRGEQGARGQDEASFALDRRVDLEFGDLSNSPILEGSLLQAESSEANKAERGKAASYADTAEGGKPTGNAAASPSTATPPSGTAKGSASGSATVGGGTK